MPFRSVFAVNADGSIKPLFNIRIGGIGVVKEMIVYKGMILAGIDLTQFTSNDLQGKFDGDTFVISGIYKEKK